MLAAGIERPLAACLAMIILGALAALIGSPGRPRLPALAAPPCGRVSKSVWHIELKSRSVFCRRTATTDPSPQSPPRAFPPVARRYRLYAPDRTRFRRAARVRAARQMLIAAVLSGCWLRFRDTIRVRITALCAESGRPVLFVLRWEHCGMDLRDPVDLGRYGWVHELVDDRPAVRARALARHTAGCWAGRGSTATAARGPARWPIRSACSPASSRPAGPARQARMTRETTRGSPRTGCCSCSGRSGSPRSGARPAGRSHCGRRRKRFCTRSAQASQRR